MTRFAFLILTLFHAVSAACHASDLADAPDVAFTGGGLSFGLVNMTQSSELAVFGASLSVGAAAKIGALGSSPIYLEWSSTMARASGSGTSTTYQETGPFAFTSNSSPVGAIDLATSVDTSGSFADAFAQVTDSLGDTVTIVSAAFSPATPGTAVSQFALSQTTLGGAFTALTTNGETGEAAAYGTFFDDTGFVFLGTGDQTATTVTTSVYDKVSYTSHSVFLSVGHNINDRVTLTTKIGHTYRRLGRTSRVSTVVDIDEGFAAAPTLPTVGLTETMSINSSYSGIMLGTTLSGRLAENWKGSLAVEAGLARFKTNAYSAEHARVATANSLIPGTHMSHDGSSAIARLTAGMTHTRPNGAIVSLNAFVDYMSDVPYISTETVAAPLVAVNGPSAGLGGTGQTNRIRSIRQKPLISSGISVSLVFLF